MKTTLLLFVLILSTVSRTQTIFKIAGDTMVCLDEMETKTILKMLNDRERLKQMDSLNKLTILVCDDQNKNLQDQLVIKDNIITTKDDEIVLLSERNKKSQEENNDLQKQVKRQRRMKNIFGITTGALAGMVVALIFIR